MNKRELFESSYSILTVDYELFGNGSGSLCACVIKPAERMLSICDRYQVPLTIFVDVTELMALEVRADTTAEVEKVKAQLVSAIERGHDVQLHIHPQWQGANRRNGQLDYAKWRIGDLAPAEVYQLLKEGKQWLEDLLCPHQSGYTCTVFRAGGWCIQPSQTVCRVLIDLGMQMDSTVAPGITEKSALQWFDFRNSPALPWWYACEKVEKPGSSLLLEVPIATGKISLLRHFRAIAHSKKINNGLAPGCEGSYNIPGKEESEFWKKSRKLMGLGNVMLDFSTMPSSILVDVTKQWIAQHAHFSSPTPVVAIGHTKNFTERSATALDEYCQWATSVGLMFSTYAAFKAGVDKYEG